MKAVTLVRKSKMNAFSLGLVIVARYPFTAVALLDAAFQPMAMSATYRYQCPFPPSSTRHCTG
jgi:hypothetical protein